MATDKDRAALHYSAMALEASLIADSPAQREGALHPTFVAILNAAAARPKRGYAWGDRSNTEPPDEAEEEAEEEDDDGDLTRSECVTGCEHYDDDAGYGDDAAADKASDRYQRDMDARHGA